MIDVAAAQDRHEAIAPEIVVTAPYSRDREAMLSGTSILTGDDLTRSLKPTIGDTLTHQPGVSATSFGPNASRPVLRGLQGERVRVLKDGIGSIDVSNTSVDHAVVVNPLTSDRIEVLRGPSALLYGSAAIGGVVNVLDHRIPRRLPSEAVHIDAIGTYGSAAQERSGFGQVDVPLGGGFVVHADGSYLRTADMDTGNFILSAPLRAQAAQSADAAIQRLASLKGKLPNSAAETWEAAIGAAYLADGGTIGASFAHYDSLYGLPLRFSLDPSIEAEAVRLKVKQDRADVRAELNPRGSLIESVRLRAAFADYRHSEIEDDGSVGTRFFNKSIEARLEAVQAQRGIWRGASGLQFTVRDFNVSGEEAFVPKNTTQQLGLFTFQEIEAGPVKAEAGLRYEHSALDAEASDVIGNPPYQRRFDAVSGAIGGSYAFAEGIRIGLSGAYTERAPAAEELFANGPHKGTQAFEIGDPNFRLERSTNVELSLRGARDDFGFGISAYHSWFDGYIYESATGALRDDLPVFQFRQGKARYWGLEGEASVTLARRGPFKINLDAVGDYTRATIKDVGAAPRIPPLRLLGGLEAVSEQLNLRGEIEWSAAQRRNAALELPTKSFTLVNASIAFHPFGKRSTTSLTLSANNIFDFEARRHASFLKDYAPLSGRDIRITARVSL